MLDTGSPFPAFELAAHDGSSVRSDDLAGRPYLLYFYPKASTPGCTKEACAFRDRWDDVREAGLELFGVSFDPPHRNRAFAERHRLPFLLLTDPGGELAKAVDAKIPLLPVPKRVSYLIGADGQVLESYPSVSPGRHADQVLADWRRHSPEAAG